MIQSHLQGVNEKDMQAYVQSFKFNDFYFPTLFPFKENYSLIFKAIMGQFGLNVAADIVARGASLDAKTREAIQKISGDIPKIAIKRVMEEDELNQYDINLKMAQGNSYQTELVKKWADDTDFCQRGVNSRLCWMALQSISRGKMDLTYANNAGVITDVPYEYKLLQKKGASVAWTSPSTADPIGDIRTIVKDARSKGIYLKYMFMNADTFATMASTEQIIKQCAGYINNLAGIALIPSKEQVNTMLKSRPDLYGIQIIVIDQNVTIEKSNGERVSGNPFVYGSVMFSESDKLGETYWKRAIDADVKGTKAIIALNNHVCVKKYGTEEIPTEVTMAIANAIPVWTSATRSVLLDATATSWSIL